MPYSLSARFEPVCNGTYLIPLTKGFGSGWFLYCSCCNPPVCSQWNWTELKPCEVTREACRLGYGSPNEIWALSRRRRETLG